MNNLTLTSAVELQAAKGKTPLVSILAYNGDVMTVAGFGPVVIELSGTAMPASVPLLADHENKLSGVVGNGTPSIERGTLFVRGALAQSSEAATKIIALHRDGVTFQASVGVSPIRQKFVRAGEAITANGKNIVSPAGGMTLVEQSTLREVSIVPLGSDAETSVSISAKQGYSNMTETLQAQTDSVNALRDREAAETNRIAGIRATCAGRYPNIEATAIQAGWSVDAVQSTVLEIVRSSGVKPPSAHSQRGQSADNRDILAAALLIHMGKASLAEKSYGEHAAQRGQDLQCHSLYDLVRADYQLRGLAAPADRNEMLKASFSTGSIPGILSSASGKVLLNAYNAFPSVARIVARKISAADFKTSSGYRLTANSVFKEVGNAGQLKHGTYQEDSYSYRVKTFGRMFGLTRQDIINDDLGAFDTMPQQIGRGAAQALESEFWTLVLANSNTFFGSDNANYFEGSGTNLQASSLATAVQKMLKAVDENGQPISVVPKWLVVPPELKTVGDELYTARTLNVGGGSTSTDNRLPGENVMFGKYEPLPVPHLSNASYSGNSAAAWYLFGDPSDVAAFGIAYLNGMESPTVETSDAPFDTLGIQMRGYLDFGVCQIDHRGGVKSKGAA